MALEWMPREDGKKDHLLHTDVHWGTEAPCVVYEKRPLKDPSGKVMEGLYTAWIRLNNPTIPPSIIPTQRKWSKA